MTHRNATHLKEFTLLDYVQTRSSTKTKPKTLVPAGPDQQRRASSTVILSNYSITMFITPLYLLADLIHEHACIAWGAMHHIIQRNTAGPAANEISAPTDGHSIHTRTGTPDPSHSTAYVYR